MATRSGIFTQSEFEGRNILKLAPDAFITINGSLGARILSPASMKGSQDLEVRGGITSMSVNAALKPAGATRATIEIVAPQYKGLHEDYYVTLPNGTRIPYFMPMMEVKIFMKGRFLDGQDRPKYYPVFWGLITEVTENYSGGTFTFSIGCQDVLNWWKHQMITVRPANARGDTLYGAPAAIKFPTVFERLNGFEVILSLFMDDFFLQTENGRTTRYDFIYAKLGTFLPPDFSSIKNGTADTVMGGLARDIVSYWDARFGFNLQDKPGNPKIPFEMFGLRSPLSSENVVSMMDQIMSYRRGESSTRRSDLTAKLDLDFGVLARVQPFGSLDLYGDSTEPLVQSKLDIANEVCEQIQMEFYVDTNGTIVFKPPFYNLNVISPLLPYYMIAAQDIINFNASINSDNIVNYMEVTSPMRYDVPGATELLGYHMDWESIQRFGLKTKTMTLRYGNDPQALSLIAAAEMAKINASAFTGSVSIPLRPEIRLGYPVYISHIDSFYYVTGITHSFSFGSAASTDLSLECRRDRMFSDGTVAGTKMGEVLKAYVYRYREDGFNNVINTSADTETKIKALADMQAKQPTAEGMKELLNEIERQKLQRQNKILNGPMSLGPYVLSKSNVSSTPDGLKIGSNPNTIQNQVTSNELLMMTRTTVPYTDINGYRHIGAFPYGANLRMSPYTILDGSQPGEPFSAAAETQTQAAPKTADTAVSTQAPTEPPKPTTTTEPTDAERYINELPKNFVRTPDGNMLPNPSLSVPSDAINVASAASTQLGNKGVLGLPQVSQNSRTAELRVSTSSRR